MFFLLHNWGSFLYQFLVGGVVFVVGLVLPLIAGDVHLNRKDDRRTVFWIIVGTVLFISFHILWQLYAIKRG